jgi:hypothetical protein
MPVITVKVFEGELTKDQTAEIIADITEAVIPYIGEVARANTWVVVLAKSDLIDTLGVVCFPSIPLRARVVRPLDRTLRFFS